MLMVDEEQLTTTYGELFLKAEVAVAVCTLGTEFVGEFIKKSLSLSPRWTTTRCAVVCEALSGVVLVEESTAPYNLAFLYSLALASETDPGTSFKLADRQAELAFKLAACWRKAGKQPVSASSGAKFMDAEVAKAAANPGEDKDGSEEDVGPLPWEEVKEPLPDDLLQVLLRVQAGVLKVDSRALFEVLPKFGNLKERAEHNNHRGDGKSKLDAVLKSAQQKVLSLQRCYAALHPGVSEEMVGLGQQFWALLLEMEGWLLKERKSNSLPSAIEEPNGLFTVEDLKIQSEKEKINRAPGLWAAGSSHSGIPYFQTASAYLGSKFRPRRFGGYGPFGKGFPAGSGFGGYKGAGGQKGKGRGFAVPPYKFGGRSSGKCPTAGSFASLLAGDHSVHQLPSPTCVDHCVSTGASHSEVRIALVPDPPLQKIAGQSLLVGNTFKCSHSATDQRRLKTKLVGTTEVVGVSKTIRKPCTSTKNYARLRAKWGSKKSPHRGNSSHDPLVFNFQRGGGRNKVEVYPIVGR